MWEQRLIYVRKFFYYGPPLETSRLWIWRSVGDSPYGRTTDILYFLSKRDVVAVLTS